MTSKAEERIESNVERLKSDITWTMKMINESLKSAHAVSLSVGDLYAN